jgi:hypothetical protein
VSARDSIGRMRFAAAVCFVSMGCSPSIGVSAAPILGGTIDDAPERYPAVVEIEDRVRHVLCSGTVVASAGTTGQVLTAAHCVLDPYAAIVAPVRPEDLVVHVGPRATSSRLDLVVTAIHVGAHDRWDRFASPSDPVDWAMVLTGDVAVLTVEGVDTTLASQVVPLLADTDAPALAGTTGDLVGFGRVGTAASDEQRRRASVHVDHVATGASGATLLVVDQRGGVGACPGDSGGPFIVTTASGPRVAAVSSAVTSAACTAYSFLEPVQGAGNAVLRDAIGPAEPSATCFACASVAGGAGGACSTAEAAAASNPDAAAFAQCLGASTPASCRSTHASGASAFDAVWSCLEGTGCVDLCTEANRTRIECRYQLDGAGPCDACMHASCCEAIATCRADGACSPCTSDLAADDATCLANAHYAAMRACVDTSCSGVCGSYFAILPGPGTSDAGTDSGIADGGATPDASSPIDAATGPDAAIVIASSGGCNVGGGPSRLGLAAFLLALFVRRRAAR